MEVFIAAINDSQAPGAVPGIVRPGVSARTVNPDDIQWGGNGEGSDRSPLTGGWRLIWRRTENPPADTSAALTCAILRHRCLAVLREMELKCCCFLRRGGRVHRELDERGKENDSRSSM